MIGMARILIATSPFGKTGSKPIDILKSSGNQLIFNPLGRRLKKNEVTEFINDVDAVIAGTEPYNEETLKDAKHIKVISRVGIGFDNVDLCYCKKNNITVTFTPEAPSDGVAELTLANILNLLRHIHASDHSVREGAWNRLMGRLVREVNIGIIGVGRIGSRVIKLLESFQPKKILATDIDEKVYGSPYPLVEWCDINKLIKESDVISLHIPMNKNNNKFINRNVISMMKTGAMFINTSRGQIVDEDALTDALLQHHLGGAALDVFTHEPYEGPLTGLDNVILTAHIAASANETRYRMELDAVEDCLRVLSAQKPKNEATID